jgi:hypothetical protein
MYVGFHLWGVCIAFSLQKPFLMMWKKDSIKEIVNEQASIYGGDQRQSIL